MWPFKKASREKPPEEKFLDAINRHLSQFPEDTQMELLKKARGSCAEAEELSGGESMTDEMALEILTWAHGTSHDGKKALAHLRQRLTQPASGAVRKAHEAVDEAIQMAESATSSYEHGYRGGEKDAQESRKAAHAAIDDITARPMPSREELAKRLLFVAYGDEVKKRGMTLKDHPEIGRVADYVLSLGGGGGK